ncbi:MAG TPA: hypothetical protein VJN67_05230 [Stellaceae bacterium]|nr:hypothetical protein [Stellaceae bacterium]
MLNWIADHWFQLVAIVILGVGFLELITLMQSACRSLEAIRDELKGLRADVAQAEPAKPNPS